MLRYNEVRAAEQDTEIRALPRHRIASTSGYSETKMVA